jgi:hypothetical protein
MLQGNRTMLSLPHLTKRITVNLQPMKCRPHGPTYHQKARAVVTQQNTPSYIQQLLHVLRLNHHLLDYEHHER